MRCSGVVCAKARVRLEYEPRRANWEVRCAEPAAGTIKDFLPAEARAALARAAALRAASGVGTPSGKAMAHPCVRTLRLEPPEAKRGPTDCTQNVVYHVQ